MTDWILLDIETTGLDEKLDKICEIGLCRLDANLETTQIWASVIGGDHQLRRLRNASEVVQEMHERSGLWDELNGDQNTHQAIDSYLADTYFKEDPADTKFILVGSSIHFDRRFIDKYLPKFASRLHYRMIDVSSVKLLTTEWSPELTFPKPDAQHRVIPDMADTLQELSEYKNLWEAWNKNMDWNTGGNKAVAYQHTSISTMCQVCGKRIEVTVMKDRGVCSINCKKKRDGDVKVPSF